MPQSSQRFFEQNRDNRIRRMPSIECTCGERILVVPDLEEMNKAIAQHLSVHRKKGDNSLTEDYLAKECIKILAKEN